MAMVRSTFAGFTTAQLALAASQRSIDAVGQNISNVNTKGYTRQRIDLASISPTGASYAMMQTDNRVGQGVQMTGVIQIRDPFLDVQYRTQLAKVGTIDAKDSTLSDIGAIFDEIDKTAVLAAMNDVVSQLNIMARPDNANQGSSDTLVRSSMEVLLNVIHENATKLADVRTDKETKLEDSDIANINKCLESISILNESIKNAQILGGAALELQDDRNELIDELATYLPISVTYHELNLGAGISVDTLEISFTDSKGEKYKLVDDTKAGFFKYIPDDDPDPNNPYVNTKTQYGVSITDAIDKTKVGTFRGEDADKLGEGVLKGTLDSLNKIGNETEPFRGIGFYERMFDSFINVFATKLNEANNKAAGDPDGHDYDLFAKVDGGNKDPFTAANIKISDKWMSGETRIITGTEDVNDPDAADKDTGNLNVLKLVNLISTDVLTFTYTGADGKTLEFKGNCFDAYGNLRDTQAIDKKASASILETRNSVLNDIANDKDSVSGVWMDEEVMDLMQFQKSYNAAAQLMSTLDEMLITLLGIKR